MDKDFLKNITDYEISENSPHNIRINGETFSKYETENIKISQKKAKQGIDIIIKKNTINNQIHIPVIINKDGYSETVYNDFFIGDNSMITIVAGCGIHNDCASPSIHNGIHCFHIGNNCNITYIEKHYADGIKKNNKFINSEMNIEIGKNSKLLIDTAQISGIDESIKTTKANLSEKSSLIIKELLMTNNNESIKSSYEICIFEKDGFVDIKSKSLAKGDSHQEFISDLIGKNKCFAHVSCDSIIMDNSTVSSTPKITASSKEANMSHEAVIGKIAQEQINKLMTLGLSEKEAENKILEGFLKS